MPGNEERSGNIYKILTETEWESLKDQGSFPGTPVDIQDGFIHLCTQEQLEGVIARYYLNKFPLYIVEFSTPVFGESLRWELAASGEYFPHVYGRELRLQDVLETVLKSPTLI